LSSSKAPASSTFKLVSASDNNLAFVSTVSVAIAGKTPIMQAKVAMSVERQADFIGRFSVSVVAMILLEHLAMNY
jgi:hypothetical protein